MLIGAFIVVNLLLMVSDGANILSVLPSSSKSHFIYPNTLLLELAASGHKVINTQLRSDCLSLSVTISLGDGDVAVPVGVPAS